MVFSFHQENMKYSESLKKNTDFQEVYSSGKSKSNRNLVCYVKENGLGINRLGISVSKKVGNSVIRHRLKRLIKEAWRLSEEKFHVGYDLVFIVRVNAKDCAYKDIESAIYDLTKRTKVLKEENT